MPDGKTDGKYVNFSSYKEERCEKSHTIINTYHNGCRSGIGISVFEPAECKSDLVFFTEGEKKAMVIAQTYHCKVVSIPGVNSFGKVFEKQEECGSIVESLKKNGMKRAVVAFDADKAENEMVSNAEKGLIKKIQHYLKI